MGLLFLVGGFISTMVLRNALIVALFSALALPVSIACAFFFEANASPIRTGFWLFGAFIVGAVGGFATLVGYALYRPEQARHWKLSYSRKAAGKDEPTR